MFCPGCGVQELETNQFCRACGGDLRAVRFALEKPDSITESAASARGEIGRAVASRIRELDSALDLKRFAHEVLPEIEKFLESPAEKRMRRIRTGTIISSIGAGAALAFSIVSAFMQDGGVLFVAGMGVVCFFIGLSFLINGLLFTVPKTSLAGKTGDSESRGELDGRTADLVLPDSNEIFTSVTEQTTKHLKEKIPVSRD